HMGIGAGNLLWMDLFENGFSAAAARFFDVDWNPLKHELQNRVFLPVLGDRYGAALEGGQIQLRFQNGAFEIGHFDKTFPVNPRSYSIILAYRMEELEAKMRPIDPVALDELKSILTTLDHLPGHTETETAHNEKHRHEKKVIKRRLLQLAKKNEPMREHIETN